MSAFTTGAQTSLAEKDDCRNYLSVKIPKFNVVRAMRADLRPALELYISVAPAEIDHDQMLALACHLGTIHAVEEALFFWICDTKSAAKHFEPGGAESSGSENDKLSCRVSYSFTRYPQDGYGQLFDWRPERSDPKRWVLVDLGPPPPKPAATGQ